MKQKILLFCLFALCTVPINAQDPSCKKYYCTAEQLELTDSMILIHLDDQTFEIDSLLSDQGGIYFFEEMVRCTYCRRPLNPKNTCECH